MEVTIKIQIGCEAALMKALTALAMGKKSAPQCVESKAAATGETADAITPGEVTATASRGTAAPVEAEKPGGGAPGDMNVAPTCAADGGATPTGDASAEVRKILAATRKRFGAVAGSEVYRKLNKVLAAIAMDLGGCTPPKLPAEKVEAFRKSCVEIIQGADGMPEYVPF